MSHLEKVRQGLTELTDHALEQVLGIFEQAQPHLGENAEPLIALVHDERERRAAAAPEPAAEPPAKVEFASKRRDISGSGNGIEEYRLLGALDGDSLVWADQHPSAIVTVSTWVPRGIRAAERKCKTIVEAHAGLLVVEIEKAMGKRGGGRASYRAGVTDEHTGVRWEDDDGARVRHCGLKKRDGQFVHVVEVDGVRREYTSG